MKSILFLMFIIVTLTIVSCTSNDSNKNGADSTDMAMPDTSTSGMGADTTSAAADSLKDSLNR